MIQNAENSEKNPILGILKNVKKSGFPTEIITAGRLEREGWQTSLAEAYIDPYERKSKEIDVFSFRDYTIARDNLDSKLRAIVLAECKRSDKNWLIFCTKSNREPLGDDFGYYISSPQGAHITPFYDGSLGRVPLIRGDDWRAFHHYAKALEWGHSSMDPHNSNAADTPSMQTYAAVKSVTSAT